MFRTGELRPVSGAPSTPGPWCSHGRLLDFGHHCRLPAAGPVLRYRLPSPEVFTDEACEGSPYCRVALACYHARAPSEPHVHIIYAYGSSKPLRAMQVYDGTILAVLSGCALRDATLAG